MTYTKTLNVNGMQLSEEDVDRILREMTEEEEEHILSFFVNTSSVDKNNNVTVGVECRLDDCTARTKFVTGKKKYNQIRHRITHHKQWVITYMLSHREYFVTEAPEVDTIKSYIKIKDGGSKTIVCTYAISKMELQERLTTYLSAGCRLNFSIIQTLNFLSIQY